MYIIPARLSGGGHEESRKGSDSQKRGRQSIIDRFSFRQGLVRRDDTNTVLNEGELWTREDVVSSFRVCRGGVALGTVLIRRFLFAGHCSSSRLVRTLGICTDHLLKHRATCVRINNAGGLRNDPRRPSILPFQTRSEHFATKKTSAFPSLKGGSKPGINC